MLSRGPSPGFWYNMRVFYDGDGYIALPLYFRFFDELVGLCIVFHMRLELI